MNRHSYTVAREDAKEGGGREEWRLMMTVVDRDRFRFSEDSGCAGRTDEGGLIAKGGLA